MKLYLVNGSSILSIPFETDYLLQTFYSMNKKEIKEVVEFIDKRGVDNFILDSGAFSLFSGTKSKMSYNFLKKYIDRYCEFINKYNIKNFIEMDIDIIIGYDEVKKINKYIESRVGRKPLYAHHIETRNIDDLTNACKEGDYIFWGGIAKSSKKTPEMNTFVDYCYSFDTRVHLLGYTPPNLEEIKNLYSCDSSSWTMGGRSGIMFQFINNKLYTINMKDKKRLTFYELNNHNFKQWNKYQQYLKNKGIITE